MFYPIQYGRFSYYTINDGAQLDLYLTKDSREILIRIEFKDPNNFKDRSIHEAGGTLGHRSVLSTYKYDSIFGFLGHYNNRYFTDVDAGGDISMISAFIDRKLEKIILQYQNHKIIFSKDKKILEYGDLKFFLKHNKVTKIIIEKDKPLSIVVKDRSQFDPPILPPPFQPEAYQLIDLIEEATK
ncbi:MAG: hypothetical protein LBP59_08095 [Planctomycetaceae bacterium]|nr:hypothetical protein [Planctomycetaceae bacterium]